MLFLQEWPFSETAYVTTTFKSFCLFLLDFNDLQLSNFHFHKQEKSRSCVVWIASVV